MKKDNLKRIIGKLLKNKLACLGILVLVIVVFIAVFTPFITSSSPTKTDVPNMLRGPSQTNPFGTDELGRDLLTRILYGARITIIVGLVAVGIAMFFGTILGLSAGFYGGKTDVIICGLIDSIWAFPAIILALVISSALGPSLRNVLIATGIVFTPAFARIVRSMVLSVRETEYVMAARAIGLNDFEIITRHVLPNVFPIMIVQASLNAAQAIITEASLSYMGVGIQPPDASWGSLLKTGFPFIYQAPWMSIFPGIAILLVVLSLNFVGDGLRDALDVKIGID
jgi:peptide/nickel transport system permease protein